MFVFGEFLIWIIHIFQQVNKYILDYFQGGQYKPKLDGKYQQPSDEIYQYNGNTDDWSYAGRMKTPRDSHSVTLLNDISKICPRKGKYVGK